MSKIARADIQAALCFLKVKYENTFLVLNKYSNVNALSCLNSLRNTK